MRLATMLLLVLAIQFSLLMFDAAHTSDTAIFGFINNPTDWSDSVFLLVIGGIGASLSLLGAFVGSILFPKSDTIIFSSLIPIFISWAVPIASLWNMIYSEVGFFGDVSSSTLVASIVCAPLIVLAITSILSWWRQGA